MPTTWPTRLAWIGGLLGLLLAVLLFAPARWLALGIEVASGGQLQLPHARGTVWNGQADLLLTGGTGSRSQTALPQGLQWQLRPTWVNGMPGLQLRLTAPCCTPQPLQLTARPQGRGVQVQVAAVQSQWPAELLVGLGTPWNTVRVQGRLVVQSPGLNLQWAAGHLYWHGQLGVELQDATSRLSTLNPLGSYRFTLAAPKAGDTATLTLETLRGELQLQGKGQWIGGRLRFRGEAQAAPGREEALANLLNIIGRRQGARSVLTIG